jgi:LytS/YehU family sensor histidine kinase
LPFWKVQLIGWSCFYVLTMVAAAPYLKVKGVFIANSVWVLVLFATSWLLRPACRASLQRRRPWFIHEAHALVSALIIAAFTVVLVDLVIIRDQPNDWSGLPLDFVQNSVVLFLWCNLYFGAKQWQEMAEQRERMLRAESELREARLNALRHQLNPHFLFNALNAVSTLVLDKDSERATRMLSRISTLLRRTLEEDSVAEIPLAQELEFISQYLEVEQIRLGERLRVTTEVPADTVAAVVPIMLLQPLVENAVRHGIAPEVDGGEILIRSAKVDSRLRLLVKNSGARQSGSLANTNGIGLNNCTERLQAIYGADYRLDLDWPVDGGCEVKLDLPFRTQ